MLFIRKDHDFSTLANTYKSQLARRHHQRLHLAQRGLGIALDPLDQCVACRDVVNQTNDLAGGPDLENLISKVDPEE